MHGAATGWLAAHGYPAEAIRHAQAGQDWALAARLLVDHWPGLYLAGQSTALHALLAAFPAAAHAANAELTALLAADELARGSLDGSRAVCQDRRTATEADRAAAGAARDDPAAARPPARQSFRRSRGRAAAAGLGRGAGRAQPGLGQELRALALISLGATEAWLAQFDQALPHLEQGTALAHRIGLLFLEFTGLAHQAVIEFYRSFSRSARLSMQAHELAERHGWTDEPGAGTACMVLGAVLAWQGQPEKAEQWIQRAERTIRAEAEPAVAVGVHHHRGESSWDAAATAMR